MFYSQFFVSYYYCWPPVCTGIFKKMLIFQNIFIYYLTYRYSIRFISCFMTFFGRIRTIWSDPDPTKKGSDSAGSKSATLFTIFTHWPISATGSLLGDARWLLQYRYVALTINNYISTMHYVVVVVVRLISPVSNVDEELLWLDRGHQVGEAGSLHLHNNRIRGKHFEYFQTTIKLRLHIRWKGKKSERYSLPSFQHFQYCFKAN